MSFSTPIYPGVDPDENLGPRLNAVAFSFITLSFVTLILRLISRLRTKVPIEADDWLILIAAILSWGFAITAVVEVQRNFAGQHIGKSDAYHLTEFSKALYGMILIFYPALTFSKLSLLAFYWRIFRITNARLPLQVVAALHILYMLTTVLVTIFSCIPIQGFWNPSIKSRCINYPLSFVTNASINVPLDLAVLLIPLYFIAQLQRSLSERISISSTFLLGLAVTVVSAVRIWLLVLDQRKPGFDPTFNLVRAALWAIVELNLWVVVASIPALRPLVTRTFRDYKEWKSRSQTKSRHTFGPGFFRGTKGRVWPSNGGAYLSARKRAPLTLNGDQTDVAGSFSFSSVHVHDYNVKISAGNRNPRESGRTLLAINDDGKASGIRIDREITVSQLPKV